MASRRDLANLALSLWNVGSTAPPSRRRARAHSRPIEQAWVIECLDPFVRFPSHGARTPMNNARVFAALTASWLVGNALSVGCGGRLTTEATETGGGGGVAGTGGSAGSTATGGVGGAGATGGSTGGSGAAGGTGGSTGGSGAAGGSGGSTGGTGGTGGSTGGSGGTGGAPGGRGGTGGIGGSLGGSGGAAGTGGVAIACGTARCTSITSVLGTLLPCCPVGEANACGSQVPVVPGTCLTATRGVPNARCPELVVAGTTLPGCCRPNGLCGASIEILGLGCNDPVPLGGPPAARCN